MSAIGPRTWPSGIEHRLTTHDHPWSCEDQKTVWGTVFPSIGQIERMNRAIKDATLKRFRYDNHDQLRTNLADVILRRGQQSSGLSPCPSSPTTSHLGSRPIDLTVFA